MRTITTFSVRGLLACTPFFFVVGNLPAFTDGIFDPLDEGDWTTTSDWNAGIPILASDATISNGEVANFRDVGSYRELREGNAVGVHRGGGGLKIQAGELSGDSAKGGVNNSPGTVIVHGGTWANSVALMVGGPLGTGNLLVSGGRVTHPAAVMGSSCVGDLGSATVSSGT